jgi:hypothetical protein
MFDDICGSVRKTFGRDLNSNILRQLLAICPEFYVQGWLNKKITLNVPEEEKIVKEEVRE